MSVGPQTERDVTLRASARRIAGENQSRGFQSESSTMQFRSRVGGATGNRTVSSGALFSKDGGRMSMN